MYIHFKNFHNFLIFLIFRPRKIFKNKIHETENPAVEEMLRSIQSSMLFVDIYI